MNLILILGNPLSSLSHLFNPSFVKSKKTAKASIDYKQQYFFSRAGLDLFKGPTINADTVVGHCGVVVGGDVAYDVADAKLCKMGASVAHIAKDYTMVAQS